MLWDEREFSGGEAWFPPPSQKKGEVLALLAFSIFINDLLNDVNTSEEVPNGYADDTYFQLDSPHGVDSTALEQLMTPVKIWSNKNESLLNAQKCHYMNSYICKAVYPFIRQDF